MPNPSGVPGPAAVYKHDHPPIRNVNLLLEKRTTMGQRVADRVAKVVGSWPFIIVQTSLLVMWIAANLWLVVMVHLHPGYLKAWDPYPFILLNLALSFQAAYTGPIVMMSQNRQSEKDRLMAQNDFDVNEKAEREIVVMMQHLAHQDELILDAAARIESLRCGDPAVGGVAQTIEEILRRLDANDRRILRLMEKVGAAEA